MSRDAKLLGALAVTAILLIAWWLWPTREHADAGEAGSVDRSTPVDRGAVATDEPEIVSVGSLSGAVLSGSDRGPALVGARVCAWALGHDERIRDPLSARCTLTDSEGRYRLSALEPGRYRVIASAARHMPAQWHDDEHDRGWLHLRRYEARSGVDLRLQSGGLRLAGIVEDVSGGPIVGALVVATSRMLGGGLAATASSDDEGRFELWVGPGEYSLAAIAAGYAPGHAYVSAPNEAIVLAAIPEAVLVGRVVDAQTNEGVAGVQVSPNPRANVRVLSGSDGTFQLAGLRPGRYQPEAVGEGLFGQLPRAIHLGLGQTSEPIELRVHPAFHLAGQLVARELDGSERGCAEGWVYVNGGVVREAQADDQGNVRVEGLPAGRYQVRPACPGQFAHTTLDVEISADLDDQRWVLEPGLELSGIVVDRSDRPLPGFFVHSEGPAGGAISFSDSEGRFSLAPLRPGTYDVWPRSDPSKRIAVELRDRSIDDIELVAGDLGTVRAIVSDGEGRPIPGKYVYVRTSAGKPLGQKLTDGEGRAEIGALAVGTVRVISADDLDPNVGGPQGVPVEIRAGEVSEVALRGESRVGSIRGSVSEEGGPASDAWVVAGRGAASEDYEVGPILCEQDGSFTLVDLPEGTWNLRAYREGGGQAIVEGVELGDTVALELEAPASLVGRVRFADASVPEQFSVQLRQGKARRGIDSSFYRSEGRFELDGLARGSWSVEVAASDGHGHAEIDLSEGERGELEIVLERRVTITGRLVDAHTRAGVDALQVAVQASVGRAFSVTATPDAEGRFALASVPVGTLQLVLTPRNWAVRSYPIQGVWITTQTSPSEQDIGDVVVVGRRSAGGEPEGDVGFDFRLDGQPDDPAQIDELRVVVSSIDAGGPAAKAGLRAGDVITSVDGVSVVGRRATQMHIHVRVALGASLTLERAEGDPVTLVAQ